MALKALMLRKKIDTKKQELETLRALDADFEKREAEIAEAVEEANTDEQQAAVDEEIEKFNADKEENEKGKRDLEQEISELESDLEEEEKAQEEGKEPEEDVQRAVPEAGTQKREGTKEMVTVETRNRFGISSEFVQREGMQNMLTAVREAMKDKRALTNVGLTVPQEFLGILKQNLEDYSKLYKYCDTRRLSGDGRMVIQGGINEAIWTECCANLNEGTLGFNDVEVDCNKVGAYFAVCNAVLEDSDVALATELAIALSKGIGLALDKAILYGTGIKMPLGVMSRLAQTAEPSGYPATARPWVDLHTTNIKSIGASVKDTALYKQIVLDSGAMKSEYSNGTKVWVMNETTKTTLIANAMAVDAAGAIVSGVNNQMPVVGGAIETLNFIPDNVIIGGYFDLYLLAERATTTISQSEHAKFLEDQTVFKGTARYDGLPVIAEGFVAIGIGGVTPDATMTFAPDIAN